MKTRRTRWSKELVIEAIRRRDADGPPLNDPAVVRGNGRLTGAARRYFGSRDAALAAAGHDPDTSKRPPGDRVPPGTWTPDGVQEQIRADVDAGLETSAHAMQLHSASLVARGQRMFGSWKAAVTAAGHDYEVIRKTRVWTPAAVIERIEELARLRADLSDMTCAAFDPSLYGAAQTHCGSWPAALEAAGVDPH